MKKKTQIIYLIIFTIIVFGVILFLYITEVQNVVIIAPVFTLIGGTIGYYLKYSLEKVSEQESRAFERKEKQYRKFLELALLGFFEGWEEKGKNKEFLKELNTNALLYASDEVLRKTYNFQYCFDNNKPEFLRENSDKYFKELVVEIRKEMKKMQGDKTSLKPEDIDIRKINNS